MAVGIVLFAIFAMIRPGMRRLSEVDSRFRISYTGTTLILVGLVIMVLGLIVLAAGSATAGFSPEATGGAVIGGLTLFGVFLIGTIIAWIGNILTFVVGAFLLYSKYQDSLYMAAGILFIIDIVMFLGGFSGIFSLVGYILMYKALDNTINKLSTAATTPAQT